MKSRAKYCCIEKDCDYAELVVSGKSLLCPNGHEFSFLEGLEIPVFEFEREKLNEYAKTDAAERHENSLRWLFKTFKTDEETVRNNLVARLQLAKGQTVLITGAGAGNDLPYIAAGLQNCGTIYAQDFSKQMTMAAFKRFGGLASNSSLDIHFSISDAVNLPFADQKFDAAYHFGGINLFADISKGISEMSRVVKTGGRVVICDEGVAPWLKHTEMARMLETNNRLYGYDAPLSSIPITAKDVVISWELSNCFFVIEFTVSDHEPKIDIDVPHVGIRGGSIRTRYLGQLEGVDTQLRAEIYAQAEKIGSSRVDFIEKLLRRGLQ